MKRFGTGLVVGKFCPLHLGHETVIARAQEDCDEVVIISYTRPEFPGCGPERREQWLRVRFPRATVLVVGAAQLAAWGRAAESAGWSTLPHNDAPAEVHRRFVTWLCWQRLGRTVDAVFTSEDYGEGFARDLGAGFVAVGAWRPGRQVAPICVDRAREQVPISGTQLRLDPHGGRRFLAPDVYASFVRRVALLGGESTGKTTLAAALAARAGTEWVAEYGRERWQAQGGRLERGDLLEIAREQCAREEAQAGRSVRWLFCDTTPLTTLFYHQHYFGASDPELARWADRSYAATILCAADFPFVQDGTRELGLRAKQQAWYEQELRRRGGSWWDARGTVEERVAGAWDYLARHA